MKTLSSKCEFQFCLFFDWDMRVLIVVIIREIKIGAQPIETHRDHSNSPSLSVPYPFPLPLTRLSQEPWSL